jgi:hypothetical protein
MAPERKAPDSYRLLEGLLANEGFMAFHRVSTGSMPIRITLVPKPPHHLAVS